MDSLLPLQKERIGPQPLIVSIDDTNACRCHLRFKRSDRWTRGIGSFLGRFRRIVGNGCRAKVFALQLELSMMF